MKKTTYLSLSAKDIIKGFILTVITAILTLIGTSINAGSLPLDWPAWKPIVLAACGAGVSYLLKNFLTNSDDQFLKKE